MKVEFIKDYKDYSAGDIADVDNEDGKLLIEAGYCKEAEEAGDGEGENDGEGNQEQEKALEAMAERIISKKLGKLNLNKAIANIAERKTFALPAQVHDPLNGIKTKTEFLYHVFQADRGRAESRNKLLPFVAKTDGQNETTNADGKYVVPETWIKEIWSKQYADTPNLLADCREFSGSGAVVRIPVKGDTSRQNRPLQYYNIAEANPLTLSKIQYAQVSLNVTGNKFAVLNWTTIEAFNDTESRIADDVMMEGVKELAFAEADQFVNGSGGSAPTGLINAPSALTVTASSGAGTFHYDDVVKMFMHLPEPSQKRCQIIMNQGLEQSLFSLTFPNSSGTYSAFGALTFNIADSGNSPWRLFGRPIRFVEQCAAPGNVGDIILYDPTTIAYLKKPIMVSLSKEYGFASDLIYFKFDLRLDIKSLWNSTVTAYKGSNTFANVVLLSNRGT